MTASPPDHSHRSPKVGSFGLLDGRLRKATFLREATSLRTLAILHLVTPAEAAVLGPGTAGFFGVACFMEGSLTDWAVKCNYGAEKFIIGI
jgi:hypothetical protein